MFGYIVPCKQQLGEAEYERFCCYYCGLCKAMGKNCSHISRLGLSYDVTFLAIVLSAVLEKDETVRCERCIVHPLKKHKLITNDIALDYSACVGVMLSYLKLLDDWHDEKSIKALAGMALMYRGVLKARRKYPEEYKFIQKCLDELSRLEMEKCNKIDIAADCFARILQRLFVPDFIEDANKRRILDWMGYNIGRWIYVIDALNDLKKDYRKNNYNPLLVNFKGDIDEYCRYAVQNYGLTLTFTLENAASAFDLLNVRKNSELLDKMIYDSLRIKQKTILDKIGE